MEQLVTRYGDVRQVLSDPRLTRALDAPDAARISVTESGGVLNSAMATVLPQTGEAHLRWCRQVRTTSPPGSGFSSPGTRRPRT
jgi:hypothetical protein